MGVRLGVLFGGLLEFYIEFKISIGMVEFLRIKYTLDVLVANYFN